MILRAECPCGAKAQQIDGGWEFVKAKDGFLKLRIVAQGSADAAALQQIIGDAGIPKGHQVMIRRINPREVTIGIEPIPEAAGTAPAEDDGLEALTKADLQAKAAELSIPLKDSDTKALIVAAIRAKQAA